jgi:hypothetical protein
MLVNTKLSESRRYWVGFGPGSLIRLTACRLWRLCLHFSHAALGAKTARDDGVHGLLVLRILGHPGR